MQRIINRTNREKDPADSEPVLWLDVVIDDDRERRRLTSEADTLPAAS
jgi:hypothetical protein